MLVTGRFRGELSPSRCAPDRLEESLAATRPGRLREAMASRRPRAPRQPLRAYVDTSVFGGVHDEEFRDPSERFFTSA